MSAPAVAQTTLVKFAGARRGNYCTLPTIDVPIIEGYTCENEDCDSPEIASIAAGWVSPREGEAEVYREHSWVHVEAGSYDHKAYPEAKCRYCGGGPEHLVSSQHAWHDQTECKRCGGVSGFAIGD